MLTYFRCEESFLGYDIGEVIITSTNIVNYIYDYVCKIFFSFCKINEGDR